MINLTRYNPFIDIVKTNYFILQSIQEIGNANLFLLKTLLNVDRSKIAMYRSGIQLAQELQLDFVIKPIELIEREDSVCILYEQFDAISLREYINRNKKLSPEKFLHVAKSLIYLVDGFHQNGWVIKNLYPENILIDSDNVCKICDLKRSTKIIKYDSVDNYSLSDLLELPYISPEQTGRLPQVTDSRSDLYSLGVIFYELLTGMLPYQSKDPLQLIHAHLALPFTPIQKIDITIPRVLADIVAKLLEKSPEERYQSAEGLRYDISQAEKYFRSSEIVKLAKKDKIKKIVPTTKLIGRKDELEILESAFKISLTGKKQSVFIGGYSGIGKTRIIQEFYRNKLSKNVPITSAKFDVLQKTTPYSALIASMQNHIKSILQKDDEILEFWRKKFSENLKDNAPLLMKVIPELSILLGYKAEVAHLPPEEAQNRFQQTFISFISTLTSEDHSLILFLDDLQWADIASIKLIEMILMDDSIRNLLFIGAFRDNEVDSTHPMSVALRRLVNWVNIQFVNLAPLAKSDTREIIRQTLHDEIVQDERFTEIIYNKTGGNIFFILQLLSALFDENVLSRTDEGVWVWDEKKLVTENVSVNVVDILTTKIESLEPRLKKLLRIASALGDEFDLKSISLMVDKKVNIVANDLAEAINIRYLIPLDENLEYYFRVVDGLNEADLGNLKNTRFKFSHDRIRQAAISSIKDNELKELNLKAARIKISNFSKEEIETDLFYIANHYINAETLIQNPDEIHQMADFAMRAGQKAHKASAFEAATRYFDLAKRHLNFETDYKQLHTLYLEQSECQFLVGDYDEVEKNLDELYQKSKTRIDKLNTLFTKVHLYNIQDKKLEAIAAGQQGYKLFNISMPRNKSLIMFFLMRDLIMASIKLPEKKIATLLDLPLMQDDEQKRFQEFILALSPTIYQYDQNLFVWNFMRMLFPSLHIGNNGISSFSYIGYGMLVSQAFGKYRMGKKLADVAIALNNKLGYTALKWKVLLSYYNFVHHWTEPIRPELDKILEVENGAYSNGDPIFAGYAIFIYNQKIFALGFPLKEVQESYESYLRVTQQRHDIETYHFLQGYYFAVRCLRGLEQDTIVMGTIFNAPKSIQTSIDQSSFTIVADLAIPYMNILFIFGHFTEALAVYEQASKYTDFIQQRYEFAEYNFYGVLICSAAYENKIPSKINYLKNIKQHVKKLKTWVDHCPQNFEPQYLIACAELEKVKGNGQTAATYYEKAINKAEQYQFVNYKAIANELAGRFQYSSGNHIMSKTFLNNAVKAYQTWGAEAKVLQLETMFKDVIDQNTSKEINSMVSGSDIGIDLNIIMQANRAVEDEKETDNIIRLLMQTIIHYSNADKGFLIIKNNNELIIKAKYSTSEEAIVLDEYADNENLPMNIINYVIRLKESLILNQPANLPEYGNNRYFQKNKPKSVICFPIIKQGEIFGLLYLENYYHEDVFNAKKINILNLISAQISSSLSNALLHQNLESKVLERTEMLEIEKGIANEMLENILPKSAIEELKRTGKTTAQKFDNVTVLMADIKGFTNISERLTPEELIGKIDFFFRSFDAIMEKYGLEKIKTIGDAYMAAGGLDGNAKNGAFNMIKAAMEMLDCIQTQNNDASADEILEMRIGLNTGSVIAGVVGTKKFQYDMWGDTVNIAARMEQESIPGRINVSLSTYEATKEQVRYTHRGKIDAKNKGALEMYFVESVI